MKKVIVIVGPTGSKKSHLAIEIAKFINGEIISADAFQVYKELNVGINKPSIEQQQVIKHHFINNISITNDWDIFRFKNSAQKIIDRVKKPIIICGGSNLYIDALIKNYYFSKNKRSGEFKAFGNEALVKYLSSHGYQEIAFQNLNNRKRLERLCELVKSDHPLSKQFKKKYQTYIIFINPNRQSLYQKLNQRTITMINNGWADEIIKLIQHFPLLQSYNAMKAIGYWAILKNNCQIDNDLIAKIQQQTRNYAKRQITWCKNKINSDLVISSIDEIDKVIKNVNAFLKQDYQYKHLYIHIPFCKAICNYCDFIRTVETKNNIELYIDNLITQINNLKCRFQTIYIGGGTPNILSNAYLKKLLSSLQDKLEKKYEFSIELNPELINAWQLKILKLYKVNRISLGVQSLNDNILKLINRQHNKKTVISKVKLAKKYFDNISCDFIYNLPLMKLKDVDDIIEFINKYQIKHVSFYALELKDNSIFKKNNYQINFDLEYDFIEHFNKKVNLKQYEVANYAASKKYQCLHNIAYWKLENWLGIGYGSVGHFNGIYTKTQGNALNYHYFEQPQLSLEQRYFEKIMMNLRLKKGINLNDQFSNNAINFYHYLIDYSFLKRKKQHLILKNLYYLNEFMIKLIE